VSGAGCTRHHQLEPLGSRPSRLDNLASAHKVVGARFRRKRLIVLRSFQPAPIRMSVGLLYEHGVLRKLESA
jgi:hypothetical protein